MRDGTHGMYSEFFAFVALQDFSHSDSSAKAPMSEEQHRRHLRKLKI